MRKGWTGIVFLLVAAGLLGCSTARPLKLSYYSRNIVIDKDNVIRIENDVVAIDNLRQELVKRTISEDTSIVLHVHRNASIPVFDAVVNRLRTEGFRNFSIDFFAD